MAPDREASASGQSLTLKHPLRAEKVEHARPRRGRHARRLRQPRDREAPAPAADASSSPASTAAATSATTSSTRARWAPRGRPRSSASPRSRSRSPRGPTSTTPRRPSSPAGSSGLVIERGLPERTLLNVNVPAGRPTGVAVTVQGRRSHEGTILEGLDPRHRTYYWIEEGRDQWVSDEMSDIFAIRSGLVSVTPAPDRHHEPPRGRRAARVGARPPAGQRAVSGAGLAARRPRGINPDVIPTGAWLSLARALGSGPRGRRFESSRPDHLRFNKSSAVRRGLERGPSAFRASAGRRGLRTGSPGRALLKYA